MKLLCEYVSSESLRKHCLAVESSMRACAKKRGQDESLWAPAGCCMTLITSGTRGASAQGAAVLRERGYPEELVTAVLGHADRSGVARETQMAKCLYAVDELSGFVMACAYVRPTRLDGMTTESVEKNLRKKGFAAKIDRSEIERGIAELGAERTEHITLVIWALSGIAKELGSETIDSAAMIPYHRLFCSCTGGSLAMLQQYVWRVRLLAFVLAVIFGAVLGGIVWGFDRLYVGTPQPGLGLPILAFVVAGARSHTRR